MWDLPGPGLEPVSPALAGGFSTTAPPGEPPVFVSDGSPCGLEAGRRLALGARAVLVTLIILPSLMAGSLCPGSLLGGCVRGLPARAVVEILCGSDSAAAWRLAVVTQHTAKVCGE